MVDSLRDQLLKCGVAAPAQAEPARRRPAPTVGNKGRRPPLREPIISDAAAQEMDLAKAYALRAQTVARERRQQEQATAEEARQRRERKAQLQRVLVGGVLNKPEADQPRNFAYAGKIRRIYVDAAQLEALNSGQLGVVQQGGRYLLVSRDIAQQVRAIDPQHLALLINPQAIAAGEDDGVPDDLMW